MNRTGGADWRPRRRPRARVALGVAGGSARATPGWRPPDRRGYS